MKGEHFFKVLEFQVELPMFVLLPAREALRRVCLETRTSMIYLNSLMLLWRGELLLSGLVVRALKEDPKAKTVCDLCKDDRKGQKIIGMEILRNLTREGKDSDYLWAGKGTILDPDNGKVYDVKMVPVEGGKRLRVRGYIGPFYRTQFWERAE